MPSSKREIIPRWQGLIIERFIGRLSYNSRMAIVTILSELLTWESLHGNFHEREGDDPSATESSTDDLPF